MSNPFNKQQTTETLRTNIDNWHNLHCRDDVSYDEWKKKDRVEKSRKYKIQLINEWRKKREV